MPTSRIEIASILSHRTREGMVEFTLNAEKTVMDLSKAREVCLMLGAAIEAAVRPVNLHVPDQERRHGAREGRDGAAGLPDAAAGLLPTRSTAMNVVVQRALPIVASAPPDATFNAQSHTYRLRGHTLPSVTQVIEEQGFTNFDEVPQRLMALAQARGTRVHTALHYQIGHGDLDWASVWPEERAYCEAALRYLADHPIMPLRDLHGQVIGVEFRFWNTQFMFAGTMDLVGWDPDGMLSITDWKTGEPSDVAAPVQTGAYEVGFRGVLKDSSPKHPARSHQSAAAPSG